MILKCTLLKCYTILGYSTKTVLLILPFLQTNITVQMLPSGERRKKLYRPTQWVNEHRDRHVYNYTDIHVSYQQQWRTQAKCHQRRPALFWTRLQQTWVYLHCCHAGPRQPSNTQTVFTLCTDGLHFMHRRSSLYAQTVFTLCTDGLH